ncbi:S8/S53 family peptidase [Polaromonas eurypsychrophila]|uniref:Peptidase S8/S53 domain-containing protein n=1 Tax=Polaromonas eurypsychrophila TaxID=1614635 RepID=A0A916WJ32_9BURK|nr:hypothetical protein [Polaromonas eurypsychrophila]GGB02422.1 hypothetical protein GCM10011496_24260 [Polaromonas eurypsychrophila]
MYWTPLPKGSFTGIDWAKPGATSGFDPYLIWAEADNFAGYGLDKPPKWLPLLIELKPGVSVAQLKAAASPKWFHVPPVYTSPAAPAGLSYCTARVRPAFFKHIRVGGSLHALVQRFELGLSADHHADDPHAPVVPGPSAPHTLLQGKVVGLIDGGLAFANANFLRNGKARTRYFWHQDEQGTGPAPADLGYGHELTAADINQAMQQNTFGGLVDETAVYDQFKMGMELNKRLNHGTHVLDIACGPRTVLAQIAGVPPALNAPPTWALADDDASSCDIVAVQLDWDTVVDTSGGSMNVHIMDGLMYILSRCASNAKVAVNLSWGTLAGPHDGSSVLEAAMDQLITLKTGRLQIVLPVSNNYQSRTHANQTLSKGEKFTLNWRGQPGDSSQNYLELWLPLGAQGIEVQLTPPGQASLPALAWGKSGTWNTSSGKPLCAMIYPKSVATGTNGTCALLAVAPTFGFKKSVATAPSGVWEVKITNTQPGKVTVDAYVERDDEIIGVKTGARQSHFEDQWYDTSGNPGSFIDHPNNSSPIRRSGNFNSIATGTKTISVGGIRVEGPMWAKYSPRKPDPDASRPERPGVVKVPDTQAYSDENPILLGLKAAGTRSGGVARLVGTSDAAPQITRKIFNAL